MVQSVSLKQYQPPLLYSFTQEIKIFNKLGLVYLVTFFSVCALFWNGPQLAVAIGKWEDIKVNGNWFIVY